MLLGANPLISVTPGLMIWTIVLFLITLYVLKRYAFGPIQKMIDERREQIRQSIEAADAARDEARKLLEEHKQLIAQARGEAEEILAEARRTGESMEHAHARGDRDRAAAPARGDAQGDRGRDRAGARADPLRRSPSSRSRPRRASSAARSTPTATAS